VSVSAQHKVIEDPNVEKRQGLLQAGSDGTICRARLGIAARVVVEEHHRGRVVVEDALCDDSRVDFAAVNCACEKVFGGDNPVASVQEDDPEDLVRQRSAAGFEVIGGCVGIG